MSVRPDRDHAIVEWLRAEATSGAPDRLVEATRERLESTRQRRVLWPARRFQALNTSIRLPLTAAAAVAVVAVVGVLFWPRSGGVATPGATPSRSAAPSSSPTPGPSLATPGLLDTSAELSAGTYEIPAGPYTPVHLTITLPAGWSTNNGFLGRGPVDAEYLGRDLVTSWIVTHVYDDICKDRTLVSAGTTAAQLTNVLQAQKGRDVSAPTSITLGGFPATRLVMTVPADLDVTTCDGGIIRFWPDPGPDQNGGLCCSALGSTDVVSIVDVPGKPFVIVARHHPASTPAQIAEIDAIVASIRIEASSSSPAPSAATQ